MTSLIFSATPPIPAKFAIKRMATGRGFAREFSTADMAFFKLSAAISLTESKAVIPYWGI